MRKQICLAILIAFCISNYGQSLIPVYVPTNSLVGWWPFSGNAKNEWYSLTDGNVVGASLTTDRFSSINSAYSFDGLNDYIDCGTNASLGQNIFTWSFWCNLSASNNWTVEGGGALIHKGCYTPPSEPLQIIPGYDINYQSLQGLVFNHGLTTLTNSTIPLFNQWSHIVYSNDGNKTKFYYNGIKIDSVINTSGFFIIYTIPTIFGARQRSSNGVCPLNDFFKGKLDDIGFWGRALSSCEIKKLYTAESFTVTSNASNTICIGQSLNLTVTGANSFTWSIGSTSQNISVSPTISTVYTVSTIYSPDCSDIRTYSVTVNSCSNLNETKFINNYLTIFPNPAKEQLTITINNNKLLGKKYSIVNTLGQKVVVGIFNNESNMINIQQLSAGLYQINIEGLNENYKFIKE